jgi:large repetitive protein
VSHFTRKLRFAVVLIAVLSAIGVTGASAGDFDGDNGPCHETQGNAALLRCPTGYVGVPYQVQIATDPDSGCYPFIIIKIVNSGLPNGLSMTQSGLISGTPTDSGLTRFWLWNHDQTVDQGGPSWCARDDVSQREFSIPIDPWLTIDTASLPSAPAGQPYSQKLTAKRLVSVNPVTTGADAIATWSLQSGALPAGITLSSDGVLSGTPTVNGAYQFVVKADMLNGAPPATRAYTLVVGTAVTVQAPTASNGEVGIPFAKKLIAAGGTGTYRWSVASGALPAGVTLDPATGRISGKPLVAGSYQVVVTATDTQGSAASTTAALNVVTRLAIRTSRLQVAKVARMYHAKLATRGGLYPLKWRVVRGKLPVGVALSRKLGTLSGTPRAAGSFRVTVEARDALGAKSRKALVLRVTGKS